MTGAGIMAILPPPRIPPNPGQRGRKMRPVICLGHLVLALSCTLQGCGKVGQEKSVAETGPRLGNPAPDFEATDLDGAPIKLSKYRGKVVLLSFYAEWCRY